MDEKLYNETSEIMSVSEEELAQVTGGYWTDCHDCPNYQHVRKCTEVKARGECPKGHV